MISKLYKFFTYISNFHKKPNRKIEESDWVYFSDDYDVIAGRQKEQKNCKLEIGHCTIYVRYTYSYNYRGYNYIIDYLSVMGTGERKLQTYTEKAVDYFEGAKKSAIRKARSINKKIDAIIG